jgi:pre-mRNA-processing factor 6
MKSCVLERISGQHQEAKRLVDVALQKFPRFDKLWMIKAQLEEEDGGDVHAAQTALANGIRNCPESVALWILASRLEERASNTAIKARTLLDAARKRIPKNELLWREAVQLELRAGNANVAKANLATALQECPQSGALWSDAILMEPRTQRRAKSMDALKRCDHDARVVCTVARVFWMERKLDKARNWFDKAAKLDADYGDAWAYWYKFEHEHGNEAQQEHVVRKCIAAEPRHGDVWPRIAKSTTNAGMSIQDVLARVANEFTD